MIVAVLPVNGARPEGPSDSGRTRFFPVGTDRPARRRPAALDRPGHSRPLLGRLGKLASVRPGRKHKLCLCFRVLIVRARPINRADTRPSVAFFSQRETARGLARAFLPRAASSAPPSPRDTRRDVHGGTTLPAAASRQLRRFAPQALRAPLVPRPPGPARMCPCFSALAATTRWSSPAVRSLLAADGCCREPARIRVGPPGRHVCVVHVALSVATDQPASR